MKQGLDIATKALALCAGAFLFGSAAWAKDEPVVLKQSDTWVANFDTESCQLITAFGEGDEKVLIRISRYAPDGSFKLDLIGKPFGNNDAHSKVKIQFGPIGNIREQRTTNGTNNKIPMLMLGFDDFLTREWKKDVARPPITTEQEAAIRWLDVAMPGKKPLRLELGSIVRPMKVMRACMTDLVRSWGYDPEAFGIDGQRPMPQGKIASWVTTDDYPREMLARGGQGIVRFRLDVDEMGNVSGCHIQQRTNPDAFADLSCKLLTKRAKFIPAHDANGKATKSFYINEARWVAGSE